MNAARVLNEVKKIIEDLEAELNLLDIKTKKLLMKRNGQFLIEIVGVNKM